MNKTTLGKWRCFKRARNGDHFLLETLLMHVRGLKVQKRY
jgi:hypothetical protein